MKTVCGFGILAVAALAQHLWRVFFRTPEDVAQGAVQKIFYLHVPAAILMYGSFAVAFLGGAGYLWRRRPSWDALSAAAMEVSLFCGSAVLLTGPFWARAAWGQWWIWDPRLTLTLCLWLILLSYFALRRFFPDGRRGPLFSAVFLFFGAAAVPLTHFSVCLWRGVHPQLVGGFAALPAEMKSTFHSGLLSFLALALFFFSWSFRLRRRARAEEGIR